MKNNHKIQSEFNHIRKQFFYIKQEISKAKSGRLWHYESLIRSRLKALRALPSQSLGGYKQVYGDYVRLLEEVSVRLLEHYNGRNRTDYRFEEIVADNYGAFIESGIVSVLVTNHIPKIVAEEFKRRLPENPKDEYPAARRMKRKFILHLGETNTGKTYDALQRLKEGASGVYLSPLRILALEVYERLCAEGVPCNLLTGQEEILTEGAAHTSSTVEKANLTKSYDIAVIDEIQLVSDPQRGDAWTRAILGLCCPEIHLCGALSAKEQLLRMIRDCGDDFEIKEYSRLVPLQTENKPVRLSEVRKGDALVAFSRKKVLSLSGHFTERGIGNSVIYGDLPPEVRRRQYDAFISGENPILIATDAIGMGVNLPIRRIIFTEINKFDGVDFRFLSPPEIKQIAGRAGRIGIYDTGYVASTEGDIPYIESGLQTRDSDIEEAVVGPSEAILEIGMLPLREKLALWSTREEALGYYRKKDVRDYLLVLDRLTPYRLPEKVQWRLMQLPFNVNSEELLKQFILYAEECFILKTGELTKPGIKAYALTLYEEFYQKVDLYYSFSKAMDLNLDEHWVYETRRQISDEINRFLA